MKQIKDMIPDALMIVGASALAYGAGLAYVPAGFVVGGLLLLVAGVVLARAS